MPTVLWWGRFAADYARNRILRQALRDLGWQVVDFRPRVSALGDLEAGLRRLARPDLLWVPCFRQRDLAAARRWAQRVRVPLVADPLISAYDKQVEERGKFPADSRPARRLLAWEGRLLAGADLVLADTTAHADYFRTTLGLPACKLYVVPVGAEESLFHPCPQARPASAGPLQVIFYGSFIPLQGPQVIVAAARALEGEPVALTLIGNGPLRGECERAARGLGNIRFEDWLSYTELPGRICAADVVLGIFGTTPKAGRVIPNKVYQALACGRAVLTRPSAAYPPALTGRDCGIVWTPAGDSGALAERLARLAQQRQRLPVLHAQARQTYRTHFDLAQVRAALAAALGRFFDQPATK